MYLLNKQILKTLLSLILFLISIPLFSQTFIIQHGTIHIGNGQVIEDGFIKVENGKILAIGKSNEIVLDKNTTIIDATIKQIYPGIIAPNNQVGLVEVEAIRPTHDDYEVGEFNANLRTLIAFNTDADINHTLLFNGILTVQPTPRTGLLSGTSSVLNLNGWNFEDATVKADDGVHLNWPSIFNYYGNDKNKYYDETISKIKTFFNDAQAYHNQPTKEKNLNFEAMHGIFSKTQKLYIHVNGEKEITEAVFFADKYGITPVIIGAEGCDKILSLLNEKNIPVIIDEIFNLPAKTDDAVDSKYALPKKLQNAGILFAMCFNGSWNVRNLMFSAGHAVAFGLTKEQAIQAITLNTAKIMGCDDKIGSLEKGKDANIIISSGDILDAKTNNIEQAFVQGKSVDLVNFQQKLYEKYISKYKAEQIIK